MLPDVDAAEVARLARAMTWKFAACRVRYAGAKAGLRYSGGDRDALLAAYKRALEPFSGTFLTGPDMGTRPSDFVEDEHAADLPLWAKSHEGMDLDDLATGAGVAGAAEAALGHVGRTLGGATVVIEGFGKVGAGTARACARAGARVIAVSTVEGALIDLAGLDVEHLIDLKAKHGDLLVEHGPGPACPREEIFELACNVLVPGARPDSVTVELAERGDWTIVAPGANVPYQAGSLDVLARRGIVAVPDFVSNSGGVHLYESVSQDADPGAAIAAIGRLVHDSVARILARADAEGTTPTAAALAEGRAYIGEESGAGDEVLEELFGP